MWSTTTNNSLKLWVAWRHRVSALPSSSQRRDAALERDGDAGEHVEAAVAQSLLPTGTPSRARGAGGSGVGWEGAASAVRRGGSMSASHGNLQEGQDGGDNEEDRDDDEGAGGGIGGTPPTLRLFASPPSDNKQLPQALGCLASPRFGLTLSHKTQAASGQHCTGLSASTSSSLCLRLWQGHRW